MDADELRPVRVQRVMALVAIKLIPRRDYEGETTRVVLRHFGLAAWNRFRLWGRSSRLDRTGERLCIIGQFCPPFIRLGQTPSKSVSFVKTDTRLLVERTTYFGGFVSILGYEVGVNIFFKKS